MTQSLPDAPDMERLKAQARRLQAGVMAGDAEALASVRPFLNPTAFAANFPLTKAQFVIARDYGFPSWPQLKRHVESLTRIGKLKAAVDVNDVRVVKRLIAQDPSLLKAKMGYGGSGPLTWAAECRGAATPPSAERLAIAEFLIDAGADIHAQGDGPLMRAALMDGRIPMMELLVGRGADVTALWDGRYPIVHAPCETLAPKALAWLLARRADPNAREGPEGMLPLDMVIGTYSRSAAQAECAEILISAGGTSEWATPATLAMHRGKWEELSRIVDNDPAIVRRRFPELKYGATGSRALELRGATLLHVAAEYGFVEATRLLLERGADVNARADVNENGVGGQTPIYHAVTQFRDYGVAVAELLIARGTDLAVTARLPGRYDHPDESLVCTPLGYAARFPWGEWACRGAIDLLMEHGAPAGDVWAAEFLGREGELAALLAAGESPDAKHPNGQTAREAAGVGC